MSLPAQLPTYLLFRDTFCPTFSSRIFFPSFCFCVCGLFRTQCLSRNAPEKHHRTIFETLLTKCFSRRPQQKTLCTRCFSRKFPYENIFVKLVVSDQCPIVVLQLCRAVNSRWVSSDLVSRHNLVGPRLARLAF